MTIVPDAAQNVTVSQVQLDNAEKTRDRIKKLVELGGASQEMLDNAESALTAARENSRFDEEERTPSCTICRHNHCGVSVSQQYYR